MMLLVNTLVGNDEFRWKTWTRFEVKREYLGRIGGCFSFNKSE
ncbi:hypothetical protein [Candidatus Hodgkinia cicadicola]